MPDIINGDLVINGVLTPRTLVHPDGSITDAHIAAGANIAATKLEHQHSNHHYQAPGSAIVAATQDVHIVAGVTGTIVGMQAAITGALADDVSRTVTVQLHKSTAGGAFASVLTS